MLQNSFVMDKIHDHSKFPPARELEILEKMAVLEIPPSWKKKFPSVGNSSFMEEKMAKCWKFLIHERKNGKCWKYLLMEEKMAECWKFLHHGKMKMSKFWKISHSWSKLQGVDKIWLNIFLES